MRGMCGPTNWTGVLTDNTSLFRKDYMGYCDQKTTEGILDFFYENGGMEIANATLTTVQKV
jgi:hypothetical protein